MPPQALTFPREPVFDGCSIARNASEQGLCICQGRKEIRVGVEGCLSVELGVTECTTLLRWSPTPGPQGAI